MRSSLPAIRIFEDTSEGIKYPIHMVKDAIVSIAKLHFRKGNQYTTADLVNIIQKQLTITLFSESCGNGIFTPEMHDLMNEQWGNLVDDQLLIYTEDTDTYTVILDEDIYKGPILFMDLHRIPAHVYIHALNVKSVREDIMQNPNWKAILANSIVELYMDYLVQMLKGNQINDYKWHKLVHDEIRASDEEFCRDFQNKSFDDKLAYIHELFDDTSGKMDDLLSKYDKPKSIEPRIVATSVILLCQHVGDNLHIAINSAYTYSPYGNTSYLHLWAISSNIGKLRNIFCNDDDV